MRKVVASVIIQCCGAKHRVGLRRDGTLLYFNHSHQDVHRWNLLIEIGADPPPCLIMLGKTLFAVELRNKLPGDKILRRFINVWRTIMNRRSYLQVVRATIERGEDGLAKKLRKGSAQLGILRNDPPPSGGKSPLAEYVRPFPAWVPTYARKSAELKNHIIFVRRRGRMVQVPTWIRLGGRMFTKNRLKQLRGGRWRKKTRSKVWWSHQRKRWSRKA